SVFGQSVIFTATVFPNPPFSGTPTGTVVFYDNGVPIDQETLNVVKGQDQATFTTNTLTTGFHVITAAYTSGDSNFSASPVSAAIIQLVNKAATSTSVSILPSPSTYGQQVTFTAKVTPQY